MAYKRVLKKGGHDGRWSDSSNNDFSSDSGSMEQELDRGHKGRMEQLGELNNRVDSLNGEITKLNKEVENVSNSNLENFIKVRILKELREKAQELKEQQDALRNNIESIEKEDEEQIKEAKEKFNQELQDYQTTVNNLSGLQEYVDINSVMEEFKTRLETKKEYILGQEQELKNIKDVLSSKI